MHRDDGVVRHYAAIAHHHQLLDAELFAQPLEFGQKGWAVGHIALVDRHRYRAAAGIGEHPVVDMQQPSPAIAAVADFGQSLSERLQIAEAMSVFLKSSPLKRRVSPVVLASA